MLIFITVYHDLKNLFRCSLKFSLNLLHTNRHTDCVGPMWVLSNSSSACNCQRRRIYSPKMVQLCSSYRIYYVSSIWRYTYCIWPCIQLRLDASIESSKGILSWSSKATKFGCWEFWSANWLLVVSWFQLEIYFGCTANFCYICLVQFNFQS